MKDYEDFDRSLLIDRRS